MDQVNTDKEKLKAIRKFKRKQWRKRKAARHAAHDIRKRVCKDHVGGEEVKKSGITKKVHRNETGIQVDAEGGSKLRVNESLRWVPETRGEKLVKTALQKYNVMQCNKAPETRKPKVAPDARKPNKKVDFLKDTTAVSSRKISANDNIKELDRKLLSCSANLLGSGTYGSCFLGNYRSIPVAVKELKDRDGKNTLEDLKKAVKKEAAVLLDLGEHKGLPFLFGICSEIKPVCLVLLFHGEGTNALTISKATKENPSLLPAEWNSIFSLTADALNYIHEKGYIHNDLKANNVVLEGPKESCNPVIIDFGSSLKEALSKPRQPSANYLRKLDSYIAPEILDGTGKPSFSSDIYSFAKMIEFVSKRCVLSVSSNVKAAIDIKNAKMRPSLAILKAPFL